MSAVLQTATASNAAAGESFIEVASSGFTPEEVASLLSMIEEIYVYSGYIAGFLLFIVLVVLCFFIYKFFNIFF